MLKRRLIKSDISGRIDLCGQQQGLFSSQPVLRSLGEVELIVACKPRRYSCEVEYQKRAFLK